MAAKRKATALDSMPPTFAAAGVMSAIVYPVDVVRALCMSQPGVSAPAAVRGFVNTHGMMGFVRQGMTTEVFRSSLARGIKFWIQPVIHQKIFNKSVPEGSPMTKSFAGVLATFPEVLAIAPMENIKLAQQIDSEGRFKGGWDVARHLYKTRGVMGGLYCGYFGMQLRQCLWTGGFFLVKDSAIDTVRGSGVIDSKLGCDIIGGFLAGAFGTCLNCWTDVVRSVIQKREIAQSFDTSIKARPGIQQFLPFEFIAETKSIFGARGIAGLYSGVLPKMCHLGLGGSILAVLIPRFKASYFEMQGIE